MTNSSLSATCHRLIFSVLIVGLSGQTQANSTFQEEQSSCNKGNGQGCFNLALSYEDGDGVAKNPKKAQQLYEKACSMRIADGCVNAAVGYRTGDQVAKNLKKAAQFFEAACKLGDEEGCKGGQQVKQSSGGQAQRPESLLRDLVTTDAEDRRLLREKTIEGDKAFRECAGRGQGCQESVAKRLSETYSNAHLPIQSMCDSWKEKYSSRPFQMSELEKAAANNLCWANLK